MPSLLVLVPWLFWPLLPVPLPPAAHPVNKLQAGMVCPGQPLPLWELGQLGVLLLWHPLPQPLSWGLPGTLEGLLPCPALVRAAMSLAICCPNSAIPSPRSVCYCSPSPYLIPDLPCSHCPHCIQWPSAVSRRFWECYIDIWWSHICDSGLCGRGSPWGAVEPQDPSISQDRALWFWLRVHSGHMVKEGTFSLLPCITL